MQSRVSPSFLFFSLSLFHAPPVLLLLLILLLLPILTQVLISIVHNVWTMDLCPRSICQCYTLCSALQAQRRGPSHDHCKRCEAALEPLDGDLEMLPLMHQLWVCCITSRMKSISLLRSTSRRCFGSRTSKNSLQDLVTRSTT